MSSGFATQPTWPSCPGSAEARPVLPARFALARLTFEPAGSRGFEALEGLGPPLEMPASTALVAVNPLIAAMVGQVSKSALTATIQSLQDFQTRYASTAACESSGAYLYAALAATGLPVAYDPFTFSTYSSRNVVATLAGQTNPSRVVILCAHYDSTSNQKTTLAPGADDNGSGTAAVVEAARIMAGRKFDYTLRFIAFSAEEWGMYGSKHYAAAANAAGEDIIGVINLDMVGYPDPSTDRLDIVVNSLSAWMYDRFAAAALNYASMQARKILDGAWKYSDQSPFWDKGYSALCGIENEDPSNPHYHTTTDTLSTLNMDYAASITKAALALAAELAQPIGAAVKSDFNGDGREDILWRYYGAGGYNSVWFTGTIGGASPVQAQGSGNGTELKSLAFARAYADAREVGEGRGAERSFLDAREAVSLSQGDAAPPRSFEDPRRIGAALVENGFAPSADKRSMGSPRLDGSANLQSSVVSIIGGADIPPVSDLNWQVAGTGDFNGDGKVDILWRYHGTGGYNCVWFMNGTAVLGGADLPNVADLSWQIQGTGDFNGDGKVDLLWRNEVSGYNCVWFMNGTAVTGGVDLPTVSSLAWYIQATGDFNGDGKTDIVWRYYGTGGYNCVWFLNGTTVTGGVDLPSVSDLAWQIQGAGDFNADGKVDILWRYYGAGGYNCLWFMNGTAVNGGADLPSVPELNWKIVSR